MGNILLESVGTFFVINPTDKLHNLIRSDSNLLGLALCHYSKRVVKMEQV